MNAYQISYEQEYGAISTVENPDPQPTKITLTEVIVAKDFAAVIKKMKDDFKVEQKDITIIHRMNKK